MDKTLIVPVHVDARFIETATPCGGAQIDFSRMPYFDGQRDRNPYTAYLGEELEGIPFDNGEFILQKGFHIHWALPDFLTRSFRFPMLDLNAMRRATATDQDGNDRSDGSLFRQLYDEFKAQGWIIPIGTNSAYASIIERTEQIDIEISQLLANNAPADKQALGKEILRIRYLLEPGGTQLPPVPNRWRIVRQEQGNPASKQEWLVESNYLVHADDGDYQTGVPFPRPNPGKHEAPYGWLGRKTKFEAPVNPRPLISDQPTIVDGGTPPPAASEEPRGEYMTAPLTALGYGEPTFAAYYPNCHSVFGFHDTEAEEGKTYEYEVYGYYAPENDELDYLGIVHKDIPNRSELGEANAALSNFYRDYLRLDVDSSGGWPEQLVCCGRLEVVANPVAEAETDPADLKVVVGSTGTEAMAALIADQISPTHKIKVEEYLESIQFLPRIEHLNTDIGPKLLEERHEQGFAKEKGGYRWVLVPRAGDNPNVGGGAPQQITLDADSAHFLHELNEKQLEFDRTDEQIKSLRRQIFTDWAKFMLCQYPPDGADDEYPDVDKARAYVENELLPWLDILNAERQAAAKAVREHVETFWHFKPGDINSPIEVARFALSYGRNLTPEMLDSEEKILAYLNTAISTRGTIQNLFPSYPPIAGLEASLDRNSFYNYLVFNRIWLEGVFYGFLPQHPEIDLVRKPHRSFYRPIDPVVLLSGDALRTSRKHGQDGVIKGEWVAAPKWSAPTIPPALQAAATALFTQYEEWKTVPARHPLMLDWLVEFHPVQDVDFDLDSYEPNYILDKYRLDLNAVDLKATRDDFYSPVGQNFWGNTLLSPNANKTLKSSLRTFLQTDCGISAEDAEDDAKLDEAYTTIMQEWGLPAETGFDDFYAFELPGNPAAEPPADGHLETKEERTARLRAKRLQNEELRNLWAAKHKALALKAYRYVNDLPTLSQAMGGFTQGLQMMRQGYQLNIADPIGYPEYQDFSRKVKEAVGLMAHGSPLPNNPFFPIRAGAGSLLELRLLDTFGESIIHLEDFDTVLTAETMRPEHSQRHFEMLPRLSQPARLNWHWLSADDDMVEQNEHPASTPVCGWIMMNRMDQSLMFYDQKGEALGYIDQEGHWRAFPGHFPAIQAEGIPNWHLRRMVLWLMRKAQEGAALNEGDSETIPHFVDLINQALRKIEPPRGDSAGEGVAMLMSRPLALVRASASLELKGLPAMHQGWQEFRKVIESPEADRESTLDIEEVAFPLRIGEDHQLNDGLVGFWEDAPDGEAYLGDMFRIPALHEISDGNTVDTDAHLLDTLTIGSEGHQGKKITFNLLMDPHGSVHATCGILPVQALELPKDLYYEALERLEVSFLTAPLLTPQKSLQLSLPNEPGFQWSWIDMEDRQWRELSTVGHFRKPELLKALGPVGEGLWQGMLTHGWITLEGDQAAIIPENKRPPSDAFPPAQYADDLKHFLESRMILPFQLAPGGRKGQEIREGWLKLRPASQMPEPQQGPS